MMTVMVVNGANGHDSYDDKHTDETADKPHEGNLP